MPNKFVSRSLTVMFCLLLISLGGFGQAARGVVSGTAKDPGGASLQGARVQLVELNKQQVTDTQGQFRFTDVPPGSYTLSVSYVGFGDFSQAVTVAAAQTATVDAVLQVASRTDEVIVRAERLQGELSRSTSSATPTISCRYCRPR